MSKLLRMYLTVSSKAIEGEDRDPTLAPADAIPKAVVLSTVGKSS